MSRLLKALPLALALAALSIFAASCGSSSPAQVRFVHAISDGPAMDVNVNGTAEFLSLSFLGVQPNQPGYTSVPSGGDTIQGFLTGTTTPVFSATANLSASQQYTRGSDWIFANRHQRQQCCSLVYTRQYPGAASGRC